MTISNEQLPPARPTAEQLLARLQAWQAANPGSVEKINSMTTEEMAEMLNSLLAKKPTTIEAVVVLNFEGRPAEVFGYKVEMPLGHIAREPSMRELKRVVRALKKAKTDFRKMALAGEIFLMIDRPYFVVSENGIRVLDANTPQEALDIIVPGYGMDIANTQYYN